MPAGDTDELKPVGDTEELAPVGDTAELAPVGARDDVAPPVLMMSAATDTAAGCNGIINTAHKGRRARLRMRLPLQGSEIGHHVEQLMLTQQNLVGRHAAAAGTQTAHE